MKYANLVDLAVVVAAVAAVAAVCLTASAANADYGTGTILVLCLFYFWR